MTEPLDIVGLVEASRAGMQEAGIDQNVASNALDAIRSAGASSPDPFELWLDIDEQIGKAKEKSLRTELIELRSRFIEQFLVSETKHLSEAFQQSPAAGWEAWLIALANAICNFRFDFGKRLCSVAFPFPESGKKRAESICKALSLMLQARWVEVLEQLGYLASQDILSDPTRSRLLISLGQIQQFDFTNLERAKEFYDAAQKLTRNDGHVLTAMGDYWIANNDFKQGKSCYEEAMNVDRRIAGAYTAMGEYFESENQLQTAEDWYRRAIETDAGSSDGYEKLLKLYGRPEFFAGHERDLGELMERAIAVGADEYQVHVDFASCYEQNKLLKDALRWFEKAIALDRTRPSGYVALGLYYEKQKRYEEAEDAYNQAIEVAPECYDGYWSLTWLYEQQEKWQEALKWYERLPRHSKEWTQLARSRIGEMHWRLQNNAEAEKILKADLEADRTNESAKDVLLQIADDYYKKRNDREAAKRIFDEVLAILGDSFKGDYHNRLGNLHYFYSDYLEASSEYSAAIAASPNTAVFHRNLALAYTELKDYRSAARKLEDAQTIDKDKKVFDGEMALLQNAEGNDCYARGNYGEAIESFKKAIEFDPSDDVLYSNLASAWERLKEPGTRMSALSQAIEAYQQAQKIRSTEKYQSLIEGLTRKREFVLRFGEEAIDWLNVVTPIAVEVASDLIPYTEGTGEGSLSPELLRYLASMKARIQDEFGVRLPAVKFRGNEADLPEGSYVISIMEIPLVMGTVQSDHRFHPGPVEPLTSLGISVEDKEGKDPLTGEEGFWIAEDDWEKLEKAGLELWGIAEYLIRHLQAVIKVNLREFLGHQEVAAIIEAESPQTLPEVRSAPGKLAALTQVCKGLVSEEVPITPLTEIYSEFDRLYTNDANLQNIVESIRSLPALRQRLPGNNSRYSILPLDSSFESDIRNSIYQSGGHAVLAMEPENCQDALTAFRSHVELEPTAVAVVEDPKLRPFVRKLIELEFPSTPVLSRSELRTDLDFQTLKPVEFEDEIASANQVFSSTKRRNDSGSQPEGSGDESLKSNEIGITVFVNEVFTRTPSPADEQSTEETLSLMRDGLFYELGIILPEVRIEIDNSLKPNEFRFRLNAVEYSIHEGLGPGEFLVNDVKERLKLLGVEARPVKNPANDDDCAIVSGTEETINRCRDVGLITWGPLGFMVLALSAEIRRNAAQFLTFKTTQFIVESLRAAFPELVEATMRRFSVEQCWLILKDLLEEEISIRDLRSIFESMLSVNGTTDADQDRYILFIPHAEGLFPAAAGKSVSNLTSSDYSSYVRTSLRRYISHKYTRGASTLTVYLLDREIEKRIGNIDAQPLTAAEHEEFKKAVRQEVDSLPPTAKTPVVLTIMGIRKTVRNLIKADFPNLAVLSYTDLSPDMNIQPIARISWNGLNKRKEI